MKHASGRSTPSGILLFVLLVVCAEASAGQTTLHLESPDTLHSVSEFSTRIDQLIADPSGGAWLLDSGTAGVIRITREGELRTWGQEGDGPGEYRQPWRITLARDTLWVTDIGSQRITGLDPSSGAVQATLAAHDSWLALPVAPGHSLAPLGVLETGEVLVAVDQPEQGRVVLKALGRGQPVVARDLLVLDNSDNELAIEIRANAPALRFPHPFASGDVLMIGGHGSFVARLSQKHKRVITWGDVLASNTAGVTLPEAGEIVSARRRDDWMESTGLELAKHFADNGMATSETAARRAIQAALTETWEPAVARRRQGILERAAFVEAAGAAWYRVWPLTDTSAEWVRVTPEGERATLETPPEAIVLDARGDWLWLQSFDSFDVPVVVRATIRRSAS